MAATAAQRSAFLAVISPIAVRQAKKHQNKIFASVCIAQAIHESGWGTSKKMAKANAVFGIKVGKSAYHFGSAWDGDAYNTLTTEYYDAQKQVPTRITDWFRAYKDLESATEDYYDMLCHCSRYKGALNQPTPRKCIEAIIAGGYATGPEYVKAIMNIINGYDLTRYDSQDISEINPYHLAASSMRKGSRGESVKWLQWELNKRGAALQIDGVFGQKTKDAVITYQQNNGLDPDGIVGPKTLRSLQK